MSHTVEQDPALMEVNPPLIRAKDYHDLSEQISSIVEGDVFTTPKKYWVLLAITGSITGLLGMMLAYLVSTGIGVWGNNQPIGWAWDITNFVFWIGINGHAGTLISAILVFVPSKMENVQSTVTGRSHDDLFSRDVRRVSSRCLHTGRPWRAPTGCFPIPNQDLNMWQNFRSPLIWDVFAVSTYFTVSLLFWYTGLIPDLATLRDRTVSKVPAVCIRVS